MPQAAMLVTAHLANSPQLNFDGAGTGIVSIITSEQQVLVIINRQYVLPTGANETSKLVLILTGALFYATVITFNFFKCPNVLYLKYYLLILQE